MSQIAAIAAASKKNRLNALLKNCAASVDNAIAGLTADNSTKLIYTTQDHNNKIYVRNPNCWAKNFNLTPISPWNSREGYARAGTLISPRHLMGAVHFALLEGTVMRFITMDNQVVERTITACMPINEAGPEIIGDLQICVLDDDVPPSIGFCKVMSLDTARRQKQKVLVPGTPLLPVLVTDQEEKALVVNWYYDGEFLSSFNQPVDPQRLAFYEELIPYDSSNPFCAVYKNELVLITVATYGGAGSGTSISYRYQAINNIMNILGGGYQLSLF